MRISPVQNITIKPITFGEGNTNSITPKIGLLSIQNSDKLNFEKNLRLTQNADAVQTNPIKALGCKFAKAYNILFSPKHEATNSNASYIHIPTYYMA